MTMGSKSTVLHLGAGAFLLLSLAACSSSGNGDSPPVASQPSAPTVLSNTPVSGGNSVPVNENLSATFSKAMDPAKVSTAKPNPDSRDSRRVIYVYTKDWADEPDVMRVRENLRRLGFVDRIGYKRNLETFAGEYAKKGKRVTYYSA